MVTTNIFQIIKNCLLSKNYLTRCSKNVLKFSPLSYVCLLWIISSLWNARHSCCNINPRKKALCSFLNVSEGTCPWTWMLSVVSLEKECTESKPRHKLHCEGNLRWFFVFQLIFHLKFSLDILCSKYPGEK